MPNCADLLMAAKIKPISRGVRLCFSAKLNTCWNSHELHMRAATARAKINPMSPSRL